MTEFAQIKKLIRQNAPVEDIIRCEEFSPAIRMTYGPVLKYISSDKVIHDLCKWVFDISKMCDEEFEPFSNSVINIFTSSIPTIFNLFDQSTAFAECMHNFLCSENSKDPVLCGFLLRILSQQIRSGKPKLIEMFDDVGELFIHRLENLAIQELIIMTAERASLNVFSKINLIDELSKIALRDTIQKNGATYLLINIYDIIADDSLMLQQYNSDIIVERLFEICATTSSCVFASDMINVISCIAECNVDILPYMAKWKDKLTLREGNINVLSVDAIDLMCIPPLDVFSLFFHQAACPYLHHRSAQILMRLSANEIAAIADIPGFTDNIINNYGTKNWCPHMMQTALVFVREQFNSKALNGPRWQRFAASVLKPTIGILSQDYGGNMTEFSSDDEYYYDEEEDFFEEEEEEADIGQNDEMDYSDSD